MAWVAALFGWVLGMILGWTGSSPEWTSLMWAILAYLLVRQFQMGRQLERLQEGGLQQERPPSVESSISPSITVPSPVVRPVSVEVPLPDHPTPMVSAPAPVVAASKPRAVVRIKRPVEGPREPDWFSQAFSRVVDWFGEGNAVVKVGVLLIFMGAVFLLRLVSARYSLPIELRFIGIAGLALAMLGVGWWQRRARHGYAMVLQGGGVGVLYLTIFAAFRLYHLLSAEWAFALMVVMVVLSSALAILQNGLALAVLGTAGGFLAPILTATGQGSHVGLFSWYLLLNAGIVGIARYRAWRSLNVLGFVFTFGIGSAWGVSRYQPEMLATCLPFLLVFFVLYLTLGVAFASQRLKDGGRPDIVDGTLVFGTPIVVFGLLTGLLHDVPWGTTWAALGFAACYLGLGWFLRQRAGYRLLLESYLAVGTVFVSLAIPLALSARWTAAGWGLEAAALVWMGLRQGRLTQRVMGYVLALAAGCAAGMAALNGYVAESAVAGVVLGGVIAATGSLTAGWLLARYETARLDWERVVEVLLLAWGGLVWLTAGWWGVEECWFGLTAWHYALLWLLLLAVVLWAAWRRGQWLLARQPLRALPVCLWLFLPPLVWSGVGVLPIEHGGWMAWPAAVMVQYLVLSGWREAASERWTTMSHALAGGLVVVWFGLLTGRWMVNALDPIQWAALTWDADNAWHGVGYALPVMLLLAGLPRLVRVAPLRWAAEAYWLGVGPVLALGLACWVLVGNFAASGNAWPLPFLPLLHPLDVLSLLVVAQLWRASRWPEWRPMLERLLPNWAVPAMVAALLFIWSNMLLVRCFHQWTAMPLTLDAMLDTMPLQAAISLLWATIALLAMFGAARMGRREAWFAGAALLAVLIGKLMLVDLSHAGGVARVVSFMGVGLFTLAMGYFAPLPARKDLGKAEEDK